MASPHPPAGPEYATAAGPEYAEEGEYYDDTDGEDEYAAEGESVVNDADGQGPQPGPAVTVGGPGNPKSLTIFITLAGCGAVVIAWRCLRPGSFNAVFGKCFGCCAGSGSRGNQPYVNEPEAEPST